MDEGWDRTVSIYDFISIWPARTLNRHHWNILWRRPMVLKQIYFQCQRHAAGAAAQNLFDISPSTWVARSSNASKPAVKMNFCDGRCMFKVAFHLALTAGVPWWEVEGNKWNSAMRGNCGNLGGRWWVGNNQLQVGNNRVWRQCFSQFPPLDITQIYLTGCFRLNYWPSWCHMSFVFKQF